MSILFLLALAYSAKFEVSAYEAQVFVHETPIRIVYWTEPLLADQFEGS